MSDKLKNLLEVIENTANPERYPGEAYCSWQKSVKTIKSAASELDGEDYIVIPVPRVGPVGFRVDSPAMVEEVWNAFVRPVQEQDVPQSSEMRVLIAILRAVYEGLENK